MAGTSPAMTAEKWFDRTGTRSLDGTIRVMTRIQEMHDDYSTKLRDLLGQARPGLALRHRLEFKRCFGAVAGYVDGNIFVSCGKFGVALRLPSQTLSELFREEDVLRLRYFPNGHVKKEYAVIPNRIIEDQGRFNKLVDGSIKYALSTSFE